MRIIAITGCIATGKSTVLRTLKQKGEITIDCDDISRKIFYNNSKKIAGALGPNCLKNGRISRQRTADLIFSDIASRRKLESIMHHHIWLEVSKQVMWHFISNNHAVFIEIPLFYELNLDRFFDSILVYVDKETQRERMILRDGDNNINRKLLCQIDIEGKLERATYIIQNYSEGSINEQIDLLDINGTRLIIYCTLLLFIGVLFLSSK